MRRGGCVARPHACALAGTLECPFGARLYGGVATRASEGSAGHGAAAESACPEHVASAPADAYRYGRQLARPVDKVMLSPCGHGRSWPGPGALGAPRRLGPPPLEAH